MEKYIGKSVYKGTAIGPVSVLKKKDSLVKRIHIDNTAEELKRLDAAKERTMTQLGQLYEKALQEVGEVNAAIFEVHQMMLEDDDYKHFGFQSGRDTNKFEAFEQCARGTNGIYYITEGTNAYISVTVNKTEDLGSHTMFIGEITDMEVISNIPSATYDYYQNNIKPKPEEVGKAEDGQTIWRCRICGYEYVGEELPDDFICPLCKHPASDFEKVVKKTEVK